MTDSLIIGWREWIELPDLEIPAVKAKVDTGARTSSLHALNIKPFEKENRQWVQFEVQPVQRQCVPSFICHAPLVDTRSVRDSGGHQQQRYVVRTPIRLGDLVKEIELTLTSRHDMKFRMLLGRTALKPDITVNPAKSYRLGGKPRRN